MPIEIRKVQVTGGSSFVLTLPKDWAEAVHLVKNEPLGVIAQPDGTLLITKNFAEDPNQKKKRFDTSAIRSTDFLIRLLIGAYISGYTTVEVFSKSKLTPEARKAIHEFARMTIGPEVTEETDNSIVARDLLNPSEMPLETTIRRMSVLVKNMHNDAIISLETKDMDLVKDVIQRDHDVNRLHWLISRQKNIILQNTGFSKKMGVPVTGSVELYLTSRIIERIGDHAVRIAENVRPLVKEQFKKELLSSIRTASANSLQLFERSVDGLFSGDSAASNAVIEDLSTFEEQCTKITKFAMRQEGSSAIALSTIAESIRRTGEYAADISENAINFHVDTESNGT